MYWVVLCKEQNISYKFKSIKLFSVAEKHAKYSFQGLALLSYVNFMGTGNKEIYVG